MGLVHVYHHTVADSGGVGSRGAVVCDLAQVADDTLTVALRLETPEVTPGESGEEPVKLRSGFRLEHAGE